MFESIVKIIIAIYVRVSTDDQTERKTIESQIEFANKYCDLHELFIYKIYKDDGITGTLPLHQRPAGSQLIQDAKNGMFNTLLVYKLDRLGRSTRVILNAIHDLEGYGVKLKSMTEPFDTGDASGRFLLTILAGVADLERSNILERMWIGANRAAREGKWLGGIVPYGYIKNTEKMLEINETPLPNLEISEAGVIRLMYKLIVENKMTTIKIAEHLNSLNIPPSYVARSSPETGRRKTNTAGVWLPGRVVNMVRSTTYKGLHQYGKRSKKDREIIERIVPAIVDADTWEEAQKEIDNHGIESLRNAKTIYMLRNMIKCGNCGYNYHGTISKTAAYYTCNGRRSWKPAGQSKCFGKSVNMYWLDDFVWNDCLNYINNPDVALRQMEANGVNINDSTECINQEKALIQKQIKQKEQEKENILDLFRKKLISSADVEKQLEKIKHEKINLIAYTEELDQKLTTNNNVFSVKSAALELLSSLKNKINSTVDHTVEFKRSIIMELIDKIVVFTVFDDNDTEHKFPNAKIQIQYKFSRSFHLQDVKSKGYTTKIVPCTDKDSWNNLGVSIVKRIDYVTLSDEITPPADNSPSRIRWSRLTTKLTQKELGELVGCTSTSIIRIEQKGTNNITMIKKLSKALNQPIWFLGAYDLMPEATLPERITKARLYHGLTIDEALLEMNVSIKSYQHWQVADRHPNADSRKKIDEFLSVLR